MDIAKSLNILHRDIVKKLNPWLKRDEIIVILGARQVGKSSLLQYLQRALEKARKQTFFLDLEDIELRKSLLTARKVISYLKALGWNAKHRAFLFLDEIHYMENFPSILKYLHDHHPGLKSIVTGSSSLKLRSKMGDPLTGRKAVFTLFPLSFMEYLNFSGKRELHDAIGRISPRLVPEPLLSQVNAAYEEYVIFGGYPKVALTPAHEMKVSVLKEIQATYIDREIRSFVADEHLNRFGALIEFLAVQNGGLVKILEIAKEMGMARDTVSRYLTILEETFIIKMLKPFAPTRSKEITRMPKLYFTDVGFLNYTLKNFQALALHVNAGALIESTVYCSLCRNLRDTEEVRFWRTKSKDEIDFILRREKDIVPIEIKWSEHPQVPKSLRKFLKNLKSRSKTAYVLTKKHYAEEPVNGQIIKYVPAWAVEFALWQR
ncbi:hypothetical protein A2Y85_02215 [candidate division WOR-3 bacterium RBG_13_43_14]|uniref:AAA+ ATPase domain-containing protein n=1 Tax=candidate division WOR-3 bacterium RBG_13_43_14 TaxID=1802590 RepID=A0A1F4UDD4_UNCW3|nr:MAG: hypothetical protein A2Y85_02215 [candidate division WOR-3 bacterium RBG_13_43_14]